MQVVLLPRSNLAYNVGLYSLETSSKVQNCQSSDSVHILLLFCVCVILYENRPPPDLHENVIGTVIYVVSKTSDIY